MREAKAKLRKDIPAQLASIPEDLRLNAGQAIRDRLAEFIARGGYRTISSYRPALPGEIDFTTVLLDLAPPTKVYFVPSTARSVSDLDVSGVEKFDLVLVPGLAFDRKGHRLGRGGGFYDRLLTQPKFSTATKVAVCLREQLLEAIPVEAHDVLVDVIITEDEVASRI